MMAKYCNIILLYKFLFHSFIRSILNFCLCFISDGYVYSAEKIAISCSLHTYPEFSTQLLVCNWFSWTCEPRKSQTKFLFSFTMSFQEISNLLHLFVLFFVSKSHYDLLDPLIRILLPQSLIWKKLPFFINVSGWKLIIVFGYTIALKLHFFFFYSLKMRRKIINLLRTKILNLTLFFYVWKNYVNSVENRYKLVGQGLDIF